MRRDMFKVIVERPRIHHGKKHHEVRSRVKNDNRVIDPDVDNYTYHEGMGRQYRDDPKELNENLAPLVRFIRSACGRKWDDVFSEICEHISVNSTVQQHVRDHVSQYVCVDIHITEDGQIYEHPKWWSGLTGKTYVIYSQFYVDPRDGLLVENKQYHERFKLHRRNLTELPLTHLIVKEGSLEFYRHHGIWYHLDFVDVRESTSVEVVGSDGVVRLKHTTYEKFDVVDRTYKYRGKARRRGKQANHKELKAYKLVNDPDWVGPKKNRFKETVHEVGRSLKYSDWINSLQAAR